MTRTSANFAAQATAGDAGGQWVVGRYTADGAPDNAFNTTGYNRSSFAEVAYDLAIDSAGRIAAVGTYGWSVAVARYNPDGTFDTNSDGTTGDFNTVGYRIDNFNPSIDFGRAIVIDPDDKIVLAGVCATDALGQGYRTYTLLARYTTAGALDTTFGGGDGWAALEGATYELTDLVRDADGRYIVAGPRGSDAFIARYTSTGAIDQDFGDGDGYITTDLGAAAASQDWLTGLALMGDGRLVASGWRCTGGDYDLVIARYEMSTTRTERLYVQQDANYNVTSLTSVWGGVIERYLYDSYGQRTVLNADWSLDSATGDGLSDVDNRNGHQGGRGDIVTGFIHFRWREFSCALGRWVSADPLGYPDGLSRYEAYRSGPASVLDPLGLQVAARVDYAWGLMQAAGGTLTMAEIKAIAATTGVAVTTLLVLAQEKGIHVEGLGFSAPIPPSVNPPQSGQLDGALAGLAASAATAIGSLLAKAKDTISDAQKAVDYVKRECENANIKPKCTGAAMQVLGALAAPYKGWSLDKSVMRFTNHWEAAADQLKWVLARGPKVGYDIHRELINNARRKELGRVPMNKGTDHLGELRGMCRQLDNAMERLSRCVSDPKTPAWERAALATVQAAGRAGQLRCKMFM